MHPRARLFSFVASCGLSLGCTETMFDLLTRDARDDSIAQGGSGDDAGPGGNTSGGGSGTPAPIGEGVHCSTLTNAANGRRLALQNVQDGGCLEAGKSSTNDDGSTQSPVRLSECDDGNAQIFESIAADSGWFELRNESANENLDVQLASPADGTLLQLYTPHQLYNQHFAFRPLSSSSTGLTQIAARHAPTQCLTVRDETLQIQPCAPSAKDQVFRLFECTEPASGGP